MNLQYLLTQNDRAFKSSNKKPPSKLSNHTVTLPPTTLTDNMSYVEEEVSLNDVASPSVPQTNINLSARSINDFSFQSMTLPEQTSPMVLAISAEDVSDEIERLSRSYPQNMESWMDQ